MNILSGAHGSLVVFDFLLYAILESYVKYHEGWLPIPGSGVMPKPYPLWDQEFSRLYRASTWFSVFGFCAMCSVHLEETCYWVGEQFMCPLTLDRCICFVPVSEVVPLIG